MGIEKGVLNNLMDRLEMQSLLLFDPMYESFRGSLSLLMEFPSKL